MHIVQKLSLSAKSFESRKKLPAKALICLRKSSRESCAKKVMHFSDKSIVTAHLFGSRFGIVVVARDTIWKKENFNQIQHYYKRPTFLSASNSI